MACIVVIFGTTGTSEPLRGVTGTNLRTQETATVLAAVRTLFDV